MLDTHETYDWYVQRRRNQIRRDEVSTTSIKVADSKNTGIDATNRDLITDDMHFGMKSLYMKQNFTGVYDLS